MTFDLILWYEHLIGIPNHVQSKECYISLHSTCEWLEQLRIVIRIRRLLAQQFPP